MERKIKTITALYPPLGMRSKVSRQELVKFINNRFIVPIDKVRKIEKNVSGDYIINSKYMFTKTDLEHYFYENWAQKERELS